MGNTDAFPVRTSLRGKAGLGFALGLGFWTALPSAAAQSRASAHYKIVADVLDAGGGIASSAAYDFVSSVGGVTGLQASANVGNRTGYIGQLYEVALALDVPAGPLEVHEATSFTLHATELWDDGTSWKLPPAEVAWTFASGQEFATLHPGGLLDTHTVYQNSTVHLIASRPPFSVALLITVLDSVEDNLGLYAGDDLPDLWQVEHFGLDNPLAAPDLDPDGDGSDNRSEYFAFTLPLDPNSVFSASIEPDGADGWSVRFLSIVNRRYWLQSSPSLEPGSWADVAGPVPGSGGGLFFPLPEPSGEDSLHFRVVMRP